MLRPLRDQVLRVSGYEVDSTLSAQVRHMIDLSAESVMSAAEALLEETGARA